MTLWIVLNIGSVIVAAVCLHYWTMMSNYAEWTNW